jgi:glycerol uptake facilitator-like aquaporin
LIYIALQVSGATIGVWTAHLIFELPLLQVSEKKRDSPAILASEFIAVFILLAVITLGNLHAVRALPALVTPAVTAGYWFMSSTSFANPAVSIARSLTDTFVGIAPSSMPFFVWRRSLVWPPS